MIATILALLVGALSALLYVLRRQWTDALLVLVAAAGLAGIVGQFTMPASGAGVASIDSADPVPRIGADAGAVQLTGDGLRASQWQDLPARPLRWERPGGDLLRLDFPQTIQLGRMFSLSATMSNAAPRKLQLLAENGQVLAEAAGGTAALRVYWLPPVAEALVLKARLLDPAGKVIAEGPVPFQVAASVPLQVQGRFGAPSFDARALNQLLAQSDSVLDWQVTLGKTVTRTETARTGIASADLLVIDAAYLERAAEPLRARVLAQVAAGVPLVVLGAGASEPALWSRLLKLELREQSEDKASGTPLALVTAALVPGAKASQNWRIVGDRIWTRPVEKGRIVWIAAGEWHRYAISEPRALGLWWQDLLDRGGIKRAQTVSLLDPEEMPQPGRRMALCAQGVSGEVSFPSLAQKTSWQRRPDKADAACVAVWPTTPGWLKFQWGGPKPQTAQVYVYAKDDWPLWQKAQKADATLRYAARTPAQAGKPTTPLPAWPFAALFMAAILLLWWRERR